MRDPRPVTLTDADIVSRSDEFFIWHTGLVSGGSWTHLTLVVESLETPGLGLRPPRNLMESGRAARIYLARDTGEHLADLSYGTATGSTPVMLCRIADFNADPGGYALRIDIPGLDIKYRQPFALE